MPNKYNNVAQRIEKKYFRKDSSASSDCNQINCVEAGDFLEANVVNSVLLLHFNDLVVNLDKYYRTRATSNVLV